MPIIKHDYINPVTMDDPDNNDDQRRVPRWVIIAIIIAFVLVCVLAFIFGVAVSDVFAQDGDCTQAWISDVPTCEWDAYWYFYEMRRYGVHYYPYWEDVPIQFIRQH